jgi:hypothetical protein
MGPISPSRMQRPSFHPPTQSVCIGRRERSHDLLRRQLPGREQTMSRSKRPPSQTTTAAGTCTSETASETLLFLGPELTEWLANLHGAPRSVAEATAQLMPFGSRASLVACGLAVDGPDIDDDGHRSLSLTDLWFEVAAAAAAVADEDQDAITRYRKRAEIARQAIRSARDLGRNPAQGGGHTPQDGG